MPLLYTLSITRRHRSCLAELLRYAVLITLSPSILTAQAAEDRDVATQLGITWVEVDAGTFSMGAGRTASEVAVDRFFMSATEITFDQYDAFCDATCRSKPSDNGWGRGSMPVFHVSYDDAVEFTAWLSEQRGWTVRLPTEMEWEFAAQGGSQSRGYSHSGGDDKNSVSWNSDNAGSRPHPVGTRAPNELGLFDMSGNLWEWCADQSQSGSSDSRDGRRNIHDEGTAALRGDSFDNPGEDLGFRIPLRLEKDSRHDNIGFRVVRSP